MITWITENVAIGEYLDAINEELLKREKIDCVLNLTTNDDLGIIEDTMDLFLGVKHFHVYVGSHQGLEPIKLELRTASYMLDLLVKKYERILVHCTSGIDRAPFVVAYWIVIKSNEEFNPISNMSKTDFKFCIANAYKFIKKKRPHIIEHMEWV